MCVSWLLLPSPVSSVNSVLSVRSVLIFSCDLRQTRVRKGTRASHEASTCEFRSAGASAKRKPALRKLFVVLVIFVGGHWFFAAFFPDAIVGRNLSESASHFADVCGART